MLIGTSSLRSSSSGACRLSASVTGMPSSVSWLIRGHQADGRDGDPARRHAQAVRRGLGEPAYGADHGLVVGHRLAHAHEDHVGDPAGTARHLVARERPGPATTCSTISAVDMLRCRPPWPVAQNGQAMPQPAWLETQSDPARVAHEDRLDQRTVEEPPQRLAGRALVGLERAQRRHQRRQQRRHQPRRAARPGGRSSAPGRRPGGRSSGSRAAWRGTPGAPARWRARSARRPRGRRGGAAASCDRAAR